MTGMSFSSVQNVWRLITLHRSNEADERGPWPSSADLGRATKSAAIWTGLDAKKTSRLPSRPGEFHPRALTEPYVNLSIHTAVPPREGCRLPLIIGFFVGRVR